jgi:hypothetical protein
MGAGKVELIVPCRGTIVALFCSMLRFSQSGPKSLTLISLWCWLNVVAMIPTVADPVIVLSGFASRGPDASLLKTLIFLNGIAISLAVTLRGQPGRIVLLGWIPVMFVNALLTDAVPTCPPAVTIAAYKQVLFGGLVPYLYVTLVPSGNFLPMHAINALVTIAIMLPLVRHKSRFRTRAQLIAKRTAQKA